MPCARPVKPPGFSDDLMGAHQPKRTVRLHRDKKLVTLAEVQPLADLGRKNQASPVSKLDAKRLRVEHRISVPQTLSLPTRLTQWEIGRRRSGLSFAQFGCILGLLSLTPPRPSLASGREIEEGWWRQEEEAA